MSNVGKLIGIHPPVPKNFSKTTLQKCADPTLLYGVELEIEDTAGRDWVVGGMSGKEDGSLRNAGYEYITSPMTFSNLHHCLHNFFAKSKVTEANYSERCSVHVHVNVTDLTVDQLSVVLLLYQTFEKLLFRYIGDDRDKNIFCVPWCETTLHYGIINSINTSGGIDNVRNWQKYTAVNLLPIMSQGSIEFRHMAGTPDVSRILHWCNIIGCLFAYAKANSLEEVKKEVVNLNTNSLYRVFLIKVFGSWFELLACPGFEIDLEDGVLQMKYSIMSKKKSTDLWPSAATRNAVNFRPISRPEPIIQWDVAPTPNEINTWLNENIAFAPTSTT